MKLLDTPPCDPFFLGDAPVDVIEGMEAVNQVATFPVDENSAPTVPVIMRRVYMEE